MQFTRSNKLKDLQQLISKMPLQMCYVTVLPEFGVKWRDLSRAVRNARLAMTPASVARVLCRHVAKSPENYDIDDILAKVRLKFVATQSRTWYVILLMEPTHSDPLMEVIDNLPARIVQALRKGKARASTPEIQTVMLDDLVYVSMQLVSERKLGPVVYAATPPGEPVVLLSTLGSSGLIKAFVEALGYKKYEDAGLHGRDVASLLRIYNRAHNGEADHLAHVPEYAPVPTITPNGIDYTNKTYDNSYVDNILGPNPPLLTDLTIKSVKPFFNRDMIDKNISLKIVLKSEDVAKTLKCWVTKRALAPTSDFFQIFHNIKSNMIMYNKDGSE
ncbi:hypothetical protein O3G_MSEX011653 [Manduca sexta]|uniref:Uncharacterized protein n=1 Tax=Manduca sexta TaxID=7130 RepID=A0A922CVI8_MANSE|nr:hypothetical protein O3G_MSEX011653 [Manduca sexta]